MTKKVANEIDAKGEFYFYEETPKEIVLTDAD